MLHIGRCSPSLRILYHYHQLLIQKPDSLQKRVSRPCWCRICSRRFLAHKYLAKIDALRLVLLYALRYETHASNQTRELEALLRREKDATDEEVALVRAILQYGGSARRGGDLFGSKKGMFKKMGTSLSRGIKGVENV